MVINGQNGRTVAHTWAVEDLKTFVLPDFGMDKAMVIVGVTDVISGDTSQAALRLLCYSGHRPHVRRVDCVHVLCFRDDGPLLRKRTESPLVEARLAGWYPSFGFSLIASSLAVAHRASDATW